MIGLDDFGRWWLLAGSKALVKNDAVKRRAQFPAQDDSGLGGNAISNGFDPESMLVPGETNALWISPRLSGHDAGAGTIAPYALHHVADAVATDNGGCR